MANGTIRFRIATQDDTAHLKQLIESAFRTKDSRQGWVGNSDLASRFSIEEKNIASVITNPESTFLIACDLNGTLLGTIGVSKRDPDTARLFMLAVDPQHHRGGIGRQILTYAEEYCQRKWAPKALGLDALSTRETLILWYMRHGFRKTGESTPFPREEFKDLDLPDDMHFVQFEKALSQAHEADPATGECNITFNTVVAVASQIIGAGAISNLSEADTIFANVMSLDGVTDFPFKSTDGAITWHTDRIMVSSIDFGSSSDTVVE